MTTSAYLLLTSYDSRFPIAIKCSISKEPQKIDLFLEEAKTMLRIGSYHDYIVNLQRIVYEVNEDGDTIPEVSLVYNTYLHFLQYANLFEKLPK